MKISETEEKKMTEENEKRVRAFYEATVPGHRESLRGLQAPHVVYDMPLGMPIGCGHFEGLQDVLERFLTSFYRALDVHFIAEEFIAERDEVVALGRIQGKTRKTGVPVDVPFAHVWTVREGYLQRMRAFTDTALLAHALAKE
jgi:uncharacterized protein